MQACFFGLSRLHLIRAYLCGHSTAHLVKSVKNCSIVDNLTPDDLSVIIESDFYFGHVCLSCSRVLHQEPLAFFLKLCHGSVLPQHLKQGRNSEIENGLQDSQVVLQNLRMELVESILDESELLKLMVLAEDVLHFLRLAHD